MKTDVIETDLILEGFWFNQKNSETVYLVDVHKLPRKPMPLSRDDD